MSEASTAAASAGDFSKPSPPAPSTEDSKPTAQEPLYRAQTTRILVLAMAVGCFWLFWIVGSWLRIPQFRRFEDSLMQQPGAASVLDFIVAALLLAGCTVAGHFIAGKRWLYAGPFVATCGLMAWAWRGGPSRYVYQHAATAGNGQTVFLSLAFELAVLSTFVGVIWYFIATRGQALAARDAVKETNPSRGKTLIRLQAIGAQIVMTALLVMLFAPVDSKKGALAAVFIGSFIAASLTEYFFGQAQIQAWYWVAPAAAGIIGYLLNFMANAAGAPDDVTGHLAGMFAPLSRAVPLDYASAGMFAALLGFWTGGEHPEIAIGMLLFSPRMSMRGIARQTKGAALTQGR